MIRIRTASFKRQAAKLMDLRQWPDAEKFWRVQARGVMSEVVNRTPPGGGPVRGIQAKKRGEALVNADVAKLFRPVTRKDGDTITTQGRMASIHEAARNKYGRVHRNLPDEEKHPVFRPVLNAYRKDKLKRVGNLAAGFNRASARVGYKPPAWIWRHKAPGDVVLKVTSRGIYFLATNRVDYASSVTNLEKRIQAGVDAQTAKLYRQVDHFVNGAARKAKFKSRRR